MNTYLKTLEEFIERTNSLWKKDDDFQLCCIDTIELSQRTLCELKSLMNEHGFNSPDEEIILFKQVKPKILSMLFASRCILQYEIEKLNWHNPKLDDLQKLYLDKLQSYFADYSEFRFYLSSTSNNRDSFYFTMNMSKNDMVMLLVPEAEKTSLLVSILSLVTSKRMSSPSHILSAGNYAILTKTYLNYNGQVIKLT